MKKQYQHNARTGTKTGRAKATTGLKTLTRDQKVLYGAAVGLVAFSATALAVTSITRTESEAATSTIGTTLDPTGYYITVTSPDELTIPTLNTTEDGVQQTVSGVVNVETNANGYGLYLAANSTTDASMHHVSNSSVTIPTTSTTGELSMNSWGFSATGEGETHSFKPVPTSGNDVILDQVSPSDSYVRGTVTNKDHDVTFGVRANMRQTAGTYSADVIFTVLGEANETGTGAASVEPVIKIDKMTGSPATEQITITTSLMTTMDYGTVSVTIDEDITCANPVATKDATTGVMIVTCDAPKSFTDGSGTEKRIQAGSYDVTVSVPKFGKTYVAEKGLTYTYSEDATIFDLAYMQEMTDDICTKTQTPDYNVTDTTTILTTLATTKAQSESLGSQGVPQWNLTDSRDGQEYQIRKLADNNCWMAQNLELNFYTGDGDGFAENATTRAASIAEGVTKLTPADSNVTSEIDVSTFFATQSKAPGASTGAWADNGSDGGHSFSWVQYDAAQAYATATGTTNGYGQKTYSTSANGNPEERGGNLYNYSTATAGSGMSITANNTSAPESICPKGWILPQKAGDYSFYNLAKVYNGGTNPTAGNPQTGSSQETPSTLTNLQNMMRSEPLSFVVAGVYHRSNGTINSRTTESSYWSSTAYSETNAYYLSSLGTNFNTQRSNYRGYGFPVRCVAE